MNPRLIDAEALKAELTGRIALPDWVLTAVLHIIDDVPTVEITKEQDRPTGDRKCDNCEIKKWYARVVDYHIFDERDCPYICKEVEPKEDNNG